MLFNSFEFLLAFLPITILGTLVFSRMGGEAAKAWIAACSLVFYAWWSTSFLWILIGSIFSNYMLLRSMFRYAPRSIGRRNIVVIGAILNMGLLGWFKYAGFITFNLNAVVGTDIDLGNIILPLGISFFTFQKLALLVDVYRGDFENIEFLDYLFFVTFFPQLIAGPIVLFQEMQPQLRGRNPVGVTTEQIAFGLSLFALGLGKKIVLADTMEHFATPVFNAAHLGRDMTFVEGWTGALCYTFQLYFDFSAYSDMAIGLAWMFGIRLPYNFNSPYKATSIIDFWRRWHITLSRFLRLYLYIPLGGGKHGELRRSANLLVVMLLGGLWHGAAWTFVAWGLLHGLFLVINHLWRDFAARFGSPRTRLGILSARTLAWLLTFGGVVVAWVLFRADSFSAAEKIVAAMFSPSGLLGTLTRSHAYFGTGIVPDANTVPQWILACLVIVLVLPNTIEMMFGSAEPGGGPAPRTGWRSRLRWRPSTAWAGFVAICLATGILGLTRPQVFIYFQF